MFGLRDELLCFMTAYIIDHVEVYLTSGYVIVVIHF